MIRGIRTEWPRPRSCPRFVLVSISCGTCTGICTANAVKTGPSALRLRHNSRALREYDQLWGSKSLEVLPNISLPLTYGGVIININPDLHVRDAGIEKIIKLEFNSGRLNDAVIRIMSQAMFEGASVAGLGLNSSSILLLDVPRQVVHRGARMRSKISRDIEAACQTITDIWPSI